MNCPSRRPLTILLILTVLGTCRWGMAQPAAEPTAEPPTVLAGFDELVAGLMKEDKVPGLAVAVIRDGQVVLAKGYGHRNVAEQLPVTAQTLFAIGSVTKSFTAAGLGMLVDEGKLDWDQSVRKWLNDFQLKDGIATEHMTPRDLVTHRSGLPRHDFLWYGSPLSRRELYDRLKFLEPSKEFRATFQYNNLMFMTAGLLIERVSGASWEDFTRERFFGPLSMVRSNFSVVDSQKTDNFALPYHLVGEEVKTVPFRNIDAVGPAGSINSSVEEMIRYVQFHIAKGKVGEVQRLSAANAEAMQSPQMVTPGSPPYEELGHSSYGLGLNVASYRGHKLVEHGGGIDGFISKLSFMPAKKIGVIVLTNLSGGSFIASPAITYNLYDRLLGLEPIDWAGRLREQIAKAKQAGEEAKKSGPVGRKEGTSPSHSLADYGGDYEHPGYGRLRVEFEGTTELKITSNGVTVPLKHFHYDIFELGEVTDGPLAGLKITFGYDKRGEIDRVAVPLESTVDDIVFKRVGDDVMRKREFLEPLAGQYELNGVTIAVELRGEDALTVTVPGQPTYTLVPERELRFALKELDGFAVQFKKDGEGKVLEAMFHQPNGTFAAKRK
ncbi:MAG TPA: serine hydrolase [Pirellulales bacterium]|nr:serine hydrolase [Pirellulales bacterium]